MNPAPATGTRRERSTGTVRLARSGPGNDEKRQLAIPQATSDPMLDSTALGRVELIEVGAVHQRLSKRRPYGAPRLAARDVRLAFFGGGFGIARRGSVHWASARKTDRSMERINVLSIARMSAEDRVKIEGPLDGRRGVV
jgi:hypothetical protein